MKALGGGVMEGVRDRRTPSADNGAYLTSGFLDDAESVMGG